MPELDRVGQGALVRSGGRSWEENEPSQVARIGRVGQKGCDGEDPQCSRGYLRLHKRGAAREVHEPTSGVQDGQPAGLVGEQVQATVT